MKVMKKLSVVIPMYNVAQYLEKCIGSVYNQGLEEEEFEIILVDDESSDNSVVIATSLTKYKKNVTIICQKNMGLGGARNSGVKQAVGKYLLFLDSDDWYLPNTLQCILSIANENQLDVLEFAAQGITANGKIIYNKSKFSTKILDGIEYYNSVRYMNSACNKLYKTDFLKKNNLFFLERIFIEDFEFNTRVFVKTKRVLATDFLVAQFLQSPNSITRNSDALMKEKMLNDIVVVLKITKETYQNHFCSNSLQTTHYFKERLGFIVATLFFQLFKNKAAFYEIKKIKQQLIEQDLFYIDHAIFQKNKDWFRIIMLNNFWIFQITQPILKFLCR